MNLYHFKKLHENPLYEKSFMQFFYYRSPEFTEVEAISSDEAKKTRFFLVNMSHCLEDGIANAFSATAVYYVDPVHPQIRSDLPHRIQSEISPLECQYV